MAAPKSVITDTEIDVLTVLWNTGSLTAREITEQLYANVEPSSMATVQKLLSRLEDKRMIRRDRSGSPHRFEAIVTIEEVAGMQLDTFAEKLSQGSLSPFVMHLVRAKRLSKRDKQRIRKLLDD
ncbi:MAG: BlaI/MecI/CopY family transcriptional regulator [Planctomycetota bacterium]